MKTTKNLIITFLMVFLFFGCSQNQENIDKTEAPEETPAYEETSTAYADDEAYYEEGTEQKDSRSKSSASPQEEARVQQQKLYEIVSSSAATNINIDEHRKIIRTADMKFKVDNVAHATYGIENIVVKFGGWVSYTNLASEVENTYTVKTSEDSSLVITQYRVTNTITIRTPWQNLDTTLKSLVPFIDYLDYRIVKAEDVTFDLLAEKMKQKRLAEYSARMKRYSNTSNADLTDHVAAEEQILRQQEEADRAYIEELKLYDNIQYSTITLNIYESSKYSQWMIPNPETYEDYKPGFGKRMWEAVKFGWIVIQEIIIVITRLWGLILLGFGVYFLIRFLTRRYKNKK
jgi:hypothetical protein